MSSDKKPVSKKRTIVTPSEKRITEKGSKDREIYIQWRSIPAMLRLLPIEEVGKMGYEVDNPVFRKLLEIRTRKDFCEEFDIGINQPAIWDREPDIQERINQMATNDNVMRFRKDVDFAFTQKVLKHGDARRMKLWKQLYEGWNERTESVNLNLNMTPADLVKEIEERNSKLRSDRASE